MKENTCIEDRLADVNDVIKFTFEEIKKKVTNVYDIFLRDYSSRGKVHEEMENLIDFMDKASRKLKSRRGVKSTELRALMHDARNYICVLTLGSFENTEEMKEAFGELINLVNTYDQKKRHVFGLSYEIKRIMRNQVSLMRIKKREFSTEYSSQSKIEGDPAILQRIVQNLLQNACRYAKMIRIQTYDEKGYAVLTISDNGKGIRDLSSAITPDYTTTTNKIGGLGLYSALEGFKHLGADYKIHTSKRGTTFIIKIPAYSKMKISDEKQKR